MLHMFVIEFFKSVEVSSNVGGLLSLQMLKLLKLTDACTRSRPYLSWRSQRRHTSLRALGYLQRKLLMAGDYPPAHLSNRWNLDRVLKSTQRAKANHQTSSCLLRKSKNHRNEMVWSSNELAGSRGTLKRYHQCWRDRSWALIATSTNQQDLCRGQGYYPRQPRLSRFCQE